MNTSEVSRRAFVQRAAALGLSTTAIGTLLAACGDEDGTTTGATPAAGAGFDPMRYAGTKVRMLVVNEGEQKALAAKKAEVAKLFGIDLEFTALAVGPLIEKINQALSASQSPYDIINVLGFSVAQVVGGDGVIPLAPYVRDPDKTPDDYDFNDFPDQVLRYTGYFDIESQTFGGSDLRLIPGLEATTPILYYRKDLLDAAGVAPPTTWEEYLAAAKTLTRGDVAGTAMIAKSGDVSLFLVDWFTRFATMGGKLMDGSPKDRTFTPRLTSDESVAALQHMVDCVQYSPQGVLQYDFTAEVDAMATGRVGMFIMWSTIAGQLYDANNSNVADTITAGPTPGASSDLAGRAVQGGWGLGIPRNSANKDAAWLVMTYLTGKEFGRTVVEEARLSPFRTSVYEDPQLQELLPSLPIALDGIEKAQILDIAVIPQAFELMTDAATAFYAALSGDASAAEACAKAQKVWTEKLKRDGHLA